MSATPRQEPASYVESVRVDVRPVEFVFLPDLAGRAGEPGVPRAAGCRYRLLFGNAHHAISAQDVVVYVGLDGPDFGRAFVTTLADWSSKFRAVEPPPPGAPPQPEGKALRVIEGPGY